MIEPATPGDGFVPADPATHPPLSYEGRTYRADKEFLWGTHRAMPPAATLERIRPHLHHAGITRVADITGLDTIGIPVGVAVRPASGTLAVEGGKGATFEAAMASAAMEAIERFVAESTELPIEVATLAEVGDRLPAPPAQFPLARFGRLSPHARYAWTPMWDVAGGGSWLVPSAHVGLQVEPLLIAESPWAPTSNGLASGNNLPEAVCAGLYEVIERDATGCWDGAIGRGARQLVVDQRSLRGSAIGTVLGQLAEAEVDAVICWCPTEVGIPVAKAYVIDRRVKIGVYKGYGCHLDPEVAIVRAVTEAVQGRTIFVAGARDDLLGAGYEVVKRSDAFAADSFTVDASLIDLDDVANHATSSFHGDIAVLVESLARADFRRVLVHEFDASAFEVAVARVIVPGLEGYRFPWAAVGRRASEFLPPT